MSVMEMVRDTAATVAEAVGLKEKEPTERELHGAEWSQQFSSLSALQAEGNRIEQERFEIDRANPPYKQDKLVANYQAAQANSLAIQNALLAKHNLERTAIITDKERDKRFMLRADGAARDFTTECLERLQVRERTLEQYVNRARGRARELKSAQPALVEAEKELADFRQTQVQPTQRVLGEIHRRLATLDQEITAINMSKLKP